MRWAVVQSHRLEVSILESAYSIARPVEFLCSEIWPTSSHVGFILRFSIILFLGICSATVGQDIECLIKKEVPPYLQVLRVPTFKVHWNDFVSEVFDCMLLSEASEKITCKEWLKKVHNRRHFIMPFLHHLSFHSQFHLQLNKCLLLLSRFGQKLSIFEESEVIHATL